ncbi:hypothetical protein NOI24_30155, partial [Neorhizobium galegae]|uniref:hypothetical protein n=1 Tax=Neorhizobium galegae TaxID=399 RepID=UPI0021080AC6
MSYSVLTARNFSGIKFIAAVFRSLPDEAHPPPMDLLTVEPMPEFHGRIETVERHASAGSGDCHSGKHIPMMWH